MKKRHAYTFYELENRYAKRAALPILKDTALNKGLYLSFKEFINNNPSVKNFEIADGRQKTITIKNEDGTSEVTRNAFGYCDGKYIWIQASNNFFPLFKEQSGLHFWVTVNRKKTSSVPYFYGIQNGIIYSSAAALGALAINALVRPETTDYIYPYYLDLENGEIY